MTRTVRGALALVALAAGALPAAAEYRSKPGAPRAPAPVVGAEVTIPPPVGRTVGAEGAVGVQRGRSPEAPGLKAVGGASDYGFDPMRDAETADAEPQGGAPRMPWPNK